MGFKIFIFFAGLVLALGYTPIARAELIKAVLLSVKDEQKARLVSDQSEVIILPDAQVLEDMQDLDVGDFFVGHGDISKDGRTLSLHSIESIGKKKILGPWLESRDRRIFIFRDFANLDAISSSDNSPSQGMRYTLIPESSDRYTIMLSDQSRIRVGTLELDGSRRMNIELLDSNSGKIQEQLTLTAL